MEMRSTVSPPPITVVIPAYNAETTLLETLSTLRQQTCTDWEAIIIDDGSIDQTLAVARKVEAEDSRFRVFATPHEGVSAARNRGIALTRTDWLLFLDADDTLVPEMIEIMLAALSNDPAIDAVHCGWERFFTDGPSLGIELGPASQDLFPWLARSPAFATHACIFRRSLIDAAGGFDPSFLVCQDWDFWQRIARTGARFKRIPIKLARYRTRLGSASQNAEAMLRNGLRVIANGHAPDPRVPDSLDIYREGVPRGELIVSQYTHAGWPAGLLLGSRQDPSCLLSLLPDEICPNLDGFGIADCLFRAVPLATCQPPESWHDLWDVLEPPLTHFLESLEERTEANGLARVTRRALQCLILEAVSTRPWTLDDTHAIILEITEPIEEILVSTGVERIHFTLKMEGDLLGILELPVIDGRISPYVLSDAIASEFCWTILGCYFRNTLYPHLDLRPDGGSWSIWRDHFCLARGKGEISPDALHDHVGWLLFLQEVWNRTGWLIEDFFEPDRTDTEAPNLAVEEERAVVDIAVDLPNLLIDAPSARVEFRLGSLPITLLTFPTKDGRIPSQVLRAGFNLAAGFEFCKIVVREALVGRSLADPKSLRARLAALNESPLPEGSPAILREASSPSVSSDPILSPGGQGVILRIERRFGPSILIGRRIGSRLDSTASRRAELPCSALDELEVSARSAGETVVSHSIVQESSTRIIYVPELLAASTDHRSQSQTASESSGSNSPVLDNRNFGRHRFETLFASSPNPWKYDTPYEQLKYQQTLELLPEERIESALELACAEGHFTVQLAPLVDRLVAADISQIALEHAAVRGVAFSNIEYKMLDIVKEVIPDRFDLIVCSEVLYYVGDKSDLERVAQKIRDGLKDGGFLLMAHSNVLADDPGAPGFDWDVPFGGLTIGTVFARLPDLRFLREMRTPYYRILLFQRTSKLRALFSLSRRGGVPEKVQEGRYLPPAPHSAAHFHWQGGAPLPAAPADAVTERLPILMYHRVVPEGSPATLRWRVTPKQFEEQISYLAQAGFRSVHLEEWHDAITRRSPLPGRAVLFTFDDGYRDFLIHAWPLLQRYGFKATVFLVADRIGQTKLWGVRHDEECQLLDWEEIRRLESEGVVFGSHSATHPTMSNLTIPEVVREASRSRALLLQNLSRLTPAFAYPYGDTDRIIQHLVGASGYEYGLTCRHALCSLRDPLLALPRIEITGFDKLHDFIAKLGW